MTRTILLKHVDISLKVNNKEIPYIKDSKLCYLIPEYNEFKLSLLPKNCELTNVFYGDSDTDCKPIGPSVDALYTNFLESDKGVYIWYSESDREAVQHSEYLGRAYQRSEWRERSTALSPMTT